MRRKKATRFYFQCGPLPTQRRVRNGLSKVADYARILVAWLQNRRRVAGYFEQAERDMAEEERAGLHYTLPSPEEDRGMRAFCKAIESHKQQHIALIHSPRVVKLRQSDSKKRDDTHRA